MRTRDGRSLDVYDDGGDGPVVLFHTGSPATGRLLAPLVAECRARGLRLVSYARPGYGGSTPVVGRSVADCAADVADLLEVERFATMGASGGGPHALGCAALLGSRVTGAVCLASPAPVFEGWLDGMHSPGALRAASAGRSVRAAFAEEFDPDVFTAADWAVLQAEWAPLATDAGSAMDASGLIDDDVAFASPWGFELGSIDVPVLLIQGGEDRMIPPSHAHALLADVPTAELWLRPRDGHVSVLRACPVALDWLRAL